MRSLIRPALVMLALFTALTGALYPLAVTAASHLIFPSQSEGSLVLRDGRVVGSSLIGQPFDDPRYFWGRPSATAPTPNNAASSGGSNLGPTNAALVDQVRARIAALRSMDPQANSRVPVDLVTSSASGLDPHISPAAARYQAPRIARLRSLSEQTVLALIEQHTERRALGVLGEPCVNVLALNLALDAHSRP